MTLYGKDLTTAQLGDIAEALDDLLLPYQIDLSIFTHLNHPDLRNHIERVGQVFYEKLIAKETGGKQIMGERQPGD